MEEDKIPQEPEKFEIPEDVYNTLKSEIETPFRDQLTSKDKEIDDLKKQLQIANKNRTIVISNKAKVEETKPEPKKKLDIFI